MDQVACAPAVGGSAAATTTFGLICLAEMGDKTQLAVAGMAGTFPPVPVWIGATLALGTTLRSGSSLGGNYSGASPCAGCTRSTGSSSLPWRLSR
jgi:putative Ca2+/H+ antiporter (TMEM165/GDT1 family)